jgi:WD40 repeat protein
MKKERTQVLIIGFLFLLLIFLNYFPQPNYDFQNKFLNQRKNENESFNSNRKTFDLQTSKKLNIEFGELIKTIGGQNNIPVGIQFRIQAFSPDSSILGVGSTNGTVYLFDVQNNILLRTLQFVDPWTWSFSIKFSPDGSMLAVADEFNINIYIIASNDMISLIGVKSTRSLAYSPDGMQQLV